MHNLMQPTEIALHISMRAWISRLKSLGQQSEFPSLCLILLVDFSLANVIDNATGHARKPRQKASDAKSKKSVRSALQNTVGWVI